jgi:hypothetical protein
MYETARGVNLKMGTSEANSSTEGIWPVCNEMHEKIPYEEWIHAANVNCGSMKQVPTMKV